MAAPPGTSPGGVTDTPRTRPPYVRVRDIRRQYPWAVAAAVYAAGFLVCQRLPWWSGPEAGEVISNVAILPLNLAFVAVFWLASRRCGLDSRIAMTFRLLAAAEANVVVADIWWISMLLVAHWDPTWSWPNIPMLAYYPLAIIAFLWLPRARRIHLEWWKFALDTMIIVIAGTVAIWYSIVRVGAARAAANHPILALAFPVCDTVLLFSLTTVALRPPYGLYTRGFGLLLVGQIMSVVGDLLYTLVSPMTTNQVRLWADALYAVSYVVLIAGAERYRSSADGVPRDGTGARSGGMKAPYHMALLRPCTC